MASQPQQRHSRHLSRSRLYSMTVDLDASERLPKGFRKFLDMKTGLVYYMEDEESEPPIIRNVRRHSNSALCSESPSNSAISSLTPPPDSSTSSECNVGEVSQDSRAHEVASMVLMACPSCRTYSVMAIQGRSMRCPSCDVGLIDFLNDKINIERVE
ncbi:hypothetical protein IFM89_038499 [Coptis chinensis]|uniref:Uncharacterized protein n=1 Tax=Coptis chinensis TaxID=261450 RepID=A0A835MBN3_9MAGN|nr:hypothetical protein IFM89_038499 [Coptis chinensis]